MCINDLPDKIKKRWFVTLPLDFVNVWKGDTHMLEFFKRRKKDDHLEKVIAYIDSVYTESEESVGREIKFSVRETQPDDRESHPREEGIKRSCRIQEPYDFEAVSSAMEQYFKTGKAKSLIKELEKAKRKTFTEMLMWHIAKTGKKDSAVYNAAQMDRRLFSKIMSDRNYKPSKDTAVALVLALHLNLEQAEDLLKRAGYSLSHSNKRDIVIEYFIREEVYDLMVINDVLYKLAEKKIGR